MRFTERRKEAHQGDWIARPEAWQNTGPLGRQPPAGDLYSVGGDESSHPGRTCGTLGNKIQSEDRAGQHFKAPIQSVGQDLLGGGGPLEAASNGRPHLAPVAYTITEGMPFDHHAASMKVFADSADSCTLRWITDVGPDAEAERMAPMFQDDLTTTPHARHA